MKNKEDSHKLVANNKKAFFDYFIEDKYEAGIVLVGTEVKSLREGKCSIKEAYVRLEDGEAYIVGMNISPYEKGNIFNRDPLRVRKLLLHKAQIAKLIGDSSKPGYTVMPLSVYFRDGRAKMEIGLARGKHNYDKRAEIAKKDLRRETQRQFKIDNL